MFMDYNKEVERILKRNGGKKFDTKSLLAKYKQVYRCYLKSRKTGINSRLVDVTDIPKDNMVEEVLSAYI